MVGRDGSLVGNSLWQYVVVHLTAQDPRLRIA